MREESEGLPSAILSSAVQTSSVSTAKKSGKKEDLKREKQDALTPIYKTIDIKSLPKLSQGWTSGKRKNINSMTPDEVGKFIEGIMELKKNGTYDAMITLHAQQMMLAHETPFFLPWHRALLAECESRLQVAVGDPSFGIPYWDWTDSSAAPLEANIWQQSVLGGSGYPVQNGPFASTAGNWQTLDISPPSSIPWRGRLFRGLGDSGVQYYDAQMIAQLFSSTKGQPYDVFRQALEDGPHNSMESWVGGLQGQMSFPTTTPNDPAFWLHHSNIDRLWLKFQLSNPEQSIVPTIGTFGPNAVMPLTFPGVPGATVGSVWNIIPTFGFSQTSRISGQTMNGFPSLAFFNNYLYTVYPDSNGSGQLYVSRSRYGVSWQTQAIPGQYSQQPALAVLGNNLCMIYKDSGSNQLWASSSADGFNWQQAQQIPGQTSRCASLAAFRSNLYTVYSDSNGSNQLWVSRSSDGMNWQQAQQITGQTSNAPALAAMGDYLYTVYPDSDGTGQLYVSRSSDGFNWQNTQIVSGQYSHQSSSPFPPALSAFGNMLYLIYPDSSNNGQLWISRSIDGLSWQDTQMISGQYSYHPAVSVFSGNGLYMIYPDTNGSGQLWGSICNISYHYDQNNPFANPKEKAKEKRIDFDEKKAEKEPELLPSKSKSMWRVNVTNNSGAAISIENKQIPNGQSQMRSYSHLDLQIIVPNVGKVQLLEPTDREYRKYVITPQAIQIKTSGGYLKYYGYHASEEQLTLNITINVNKTCSMGPNFNRIPISEVPLSEWEGIYITQAPWGLNFNPLQVFEDGSLVIMETIINGTYDPSSATFSWDWFDSNTDLGVTSGSITFSSGSSNSFVGSIYPYPGSNPVRYTGQLKDAFPAPSLSNIQLINGFLMNNDQCNFYTSDNKPLTIAVDTSLVVNPSALLGTLFTVQIVSNGFLLQANGNYLTTNKENFLFCNAQSQSSATVFQLYASVDGPMLIQASSGYYWTINSNNSISINPASALSTNIEFQPNLLNLPFVSYNLFQPKVGTYSCIVAEAQFLATGILGLVGATGDLVYTSLSAPFTNAVINYLQNLPTYQTLQQTLLNLIQNASTGGAAKTAILFGAFFATVYAHHPEIIWGLLRLAWEYGLITAVGLLILKKFVVYLVMPEVALGETIANFMLLANNLYSLAIAANQACSETIKNRIDPSNLLDEKSLHLSLEKIRTARINADREKKMIPLSSPSKGEQKSSIPVHKILEDILKKARGEIKESKVRDAKSADRNKSSEEPKLLPKLDSDISRIRQSSSRTASSFFQKGENSPVVITLPKSASEDKSSRLSLGVKTEIIRQLDNYIKEHASPDKEAKAKEAKALKSIIETEGNHEKILASLKEVRTRYKPSSKNSNFLKLVDDAEKLIKQDYPQGAAKRPSVPQSPHSPGSNMASGQSVRMSGLGGAASNNSRSSSSTSNSSSSISNPRSPTR